MLVPAAARAGTEYGGSGWFQEWFQGVGAFPRHSTMLSLSQSLVIRYARVSINAIHVLHRPNKTAHDQAGARC